jgi:proline iminopeptidase
MAAPKREQRDLTQPQPQQARLTEHGLFTDMRGAADLPPLLFLHGGPGQGCYDFMALQGDRLATRARVIGLDQRGVDRSAPIGRGALTLADLVADCEALRETLGIKRWAVLGHSFGGMTALRYATAHPEAITGVILENPALDMTLASRAALPRAAALLESLGKPDPAREALAALDESRPGTGAAAEGGAAGSRAQASRSGGSGPGGSGPDGSGAAERREAARALRLAYVAALQALGDDRESFFTPDPATRARIERIHAERPGRSPADEQASEASTTLHHLAVLADDACYEPGLRLLPRLAAPALLITGGQDPVTSDALREAFRAASPANHLIEFPQAGHFAHADDPAAYAAAVTGFLTRPRARSRAGRHP